MDITERREAEEAPNETERRFATVLANARAYVYRCRNEKGYPNEFASDYALELTGYPPEDLLLGGPVTFGELILEEDRQRVWEEIQGALGRRERFELRYSIRRRDGEVRHVEEFGQGVYDERGNVVALEGIVYDVTELKRTEKRLREAEARYRTLVEQVPAVTYIQEATDPNAVTYVSPQIELMLGYKPEKCTSDPGYWIRILHPADRRRVQAEDRRTNETGEPFCMEYRQFAKDGRVVWVRDEAVLVHDEDGNPSYWLGVQHDITERKRAEEALKESELRLRTVITNVPVVLFALDRAGVFTLSEGRGLEVLGLEPGEVVGRSISEVYGDRLEILEDIDRALAGEEFSAVREVASRTFETWYSPLRESTGGVSGVIGVATDVTERKRAGEMQARLARQAELRADTSAALAESGALEDILRRCAEALVRHLDVAFARIWTLNEDENVLELQASAGMYTHTDGPHSRVPVGDLKIGLIAQERRPHLTNDVLGDPRVSDKAWARREGMVAFAGYPLLVEERLVGVMAMFAREELAEDVIEALGSVADIIAQGIERKRIEEALYRSEERFRALVQNASDVIAVIDADGTVTYESSSVERVLGYKPEELVGNSGFALVHPDDLPMAQSAFAELLSSPGATRSAEVRGRHRDGTWRHLEVIGTNLLHEPSIAGVVVNYRDITERKRVEEEIKEVNQHLEELAVLKADFTAMVAHELDTPLAVIRGYADMLATGELDPAGRERALAKIQAETDVMAALIADARHAAAIEREDFVVKPREVPIGALMRDATAFAETRCENHPLVIENVADGQVWADLYRIGQVLRNLLSNAAKYSPAGAPIELRTVPGETPGHIRIEVADQGIGVHPDDVNRIFEKFGRGRDRSGRKVAGVGLGLYLSRRILQAHGSDLTLTPAPGGGSVFGFELEAVR